MKRAMVVAAASTGVVVIAAGVAFFSMVRSGLSTHDEPTAMEAFVASAVRRWAVPAELRTAKNPIPLTPDVLAAGRGHFADHCAGCHGNDGKGVEGLGKQMYPRTPDMTLAATQSLSDGELFAIIENGVRLTGMPGFGNGTAASAESTWHLVHFIRHLPKVTPEELDAMRKLNPKSPEEWREMQEEEAFLSGDETTAPPAATSHHH